MIEATRLAATLGQKPPSGFLPPLWHWTLFQHWAPPDALGKDGHPMRENGLEDLPRRMWAGSRIDFLRPIALAGEVTRTTAASAITERTGRSGRLAFLTLRHTLSQDGAAVLTEEQDIVYRAIAPYVAPPPNPPAEEAGFSRTVVPDTVLLFRFSALTGNSHRIHYDLPYTRHTELYPGLVVHGPLIAILLAETWRAQEAYRPLRQMTIRALAPVFCGAALTLAGTASPDGATLQALDERGSAFLRIETVCAVQG